LPKTAFYPHDVVSAVYVTSTWLADWVSVTRQYCIKTAKPIVKLFRPSYRMEAVNDAQNVRVDIILVFFWLLRRYPNPRGTPLAGALNTRGWENWRYSTDNAVYLGNGARQADGYYRTLIGSHGCRIEWYHFRWLWVTPNPGFKVSVYLQVEYLKNGAI